MSQSHRRVCRPGKPVGLPLSAGCVRGWPFHSLGVTNRATMKLSRSTFETHVFVLNWDSLEKLHGAIAAHLAVVTITAKCADQLDRQFASIDELKNFDNPARAAISELQITGRDAKHEQRFSLSLSNERRSNIRVSLDADEENGLPLNALANDTVESLQPWYWWIAKADWYWLVLGGWISTQLLLLTLKLALAGDNYD